MSSQTVHSTSQKPDALRRAMRSNGVFSGLSGVVMLLDARPLANFMGLEAPIILRILGAVLVVYAVALFLATSRRDIDARLAWTAVALDIGWVVGSGAILLAGWPTLTVAGNWTVALLAEAVALFAIWQAYALRRLKKGGST